jgi:HEPN domain-containing protein
MRETVRLILEVAKHRMEAASSLTHSTGQRYASGELLWALSTELLLKAALLASGKRYDRQQTCVGLWDELPEAVREQIITVARQEHDDLMDLRDVRRILSASDDVVESSKYSADDIEKWSSFEDQRLIREHLPLLSMETAPHFPLEDSRLRAGLIHYVETAL